MRTLILLALAIALSACAQPMWNAPPGVTQQQFARDQAFCNAQANMAAMGTGGLMGVAIFGQNKQMCMEGKGYTLVKD